jgi:hypothetical protein
MYSIEIEVEKQKSDFRLKKRCHVMTYEMGDEKDYSCQPCLAKKR